jgi:hypothetical protein
MEVSRTQLGIAAGAGGFVLLVFFISLAWLNRQGPVLSRSPERDPLSGIPIDISLNPLRDRSSERTAAKFLRSMQEGHCAEELSVWTKDYRKKYAAFICGAETRHPLLGWKLAEWEDAPPLRILQYRGTRQNDPGKEGTYKELLSVTLQNTSGEWVVTKYDAMY